MSKTPTLPSDVFVNDPTAAFPGTITEDTTLNNGGVLTAATLQVGGDITTAANAGLTFQQAAPAELSVTSSAQNVGTRFDLASLTLGTDWHLNPVSPPASGTLEVSGNSRVDTTQMTMVDNSLVVIDPTSTVVVGSAQVQDGALVIASTATLTAASGTIAADVALNGWIVQVPTITLLDLGHKFAITGRLTGSGTLDAGISSNIGTPQSATLEIGDASSFAGSIVLGAGQMLVLDRGGAGHAALTMANATVDLASVQDDNTVPLYNAQTGMLVVGTATLNVGTGYEATDFNSAPDFSGGTVVTERGLPCYVAGTAIRTADGEVAVERIRPGDIVRTHDGRLAPVAWVGQTRVDLKRHPAPQHAAPIRISAGAVAPGLPARDLLLSPDHALLIGGVLMPARLLVNGATIASDLSRADVVYVHIELDRHDLLVAEGLPAESYLDTGNRGLFTAEAGVRSLFPDLADAGGVAASQRVFAARGYAELVLEGPLVAAAKRGILARAAALGFAANDDPALSLDVDGRACSLAPRDGRWHVGLPPGARAARLISRVWVPARMRPDEDDNRSLGVAIARMWLDGREVSMASPAFGAGWYAAEPDWRWTDGNAAMALEGVRRLSFEVAMTGTYWAVPAGRRVSRARRPATGAR